MSRKKFTPDLLDRAKVLLQQDGASFTTVGRQLDVHGECLRVAMAKAGIVPDRGRRIAPNAKPFDEAEFIALYRAGRSIKSLSSQLGAERKTLTDTLIRLGEPVRGRSAAMFTRMSQTSEEDRKKLAQRANEASRGKPKSIEHRDKIVLTRFARQTHVGAGEHSLANALRSRGVEVVTQAPCGTYNIDLLCLGRVAVEIHTASAFPATMPHHSERIKDLLDRGVVPVYLCGPRAAVWWQTIADQLIPFIEEASRFPAGSREYRVIRGAPKHYAIVRNDLGQFSAVPAPPRFDWKASILNG